MPYLKSILVNATDKSNRMLRAKAMECISLVGMAVGKEKFRDDAKQVSCKLIKCFLPFVEKRQTMEETICCILGDPGYGGMFACTRAYFHVPKCLLLALLLFYFGMFVDCPFLSSAKFCYILTLFSSES